MPMQPSEKSSVFVLQHVARANQLDEGVKLLGVYSTLASAEEAVARLRPLLGFASYPDGFSIDEYTLDVDHWTEGFVEL